MTDLLDRCIQGMAICAADETAENTYNAWLWVHNVLYDITAADSIELDEFTKNHLATWCESQFDFDEFKVIAYSMQNHLTRIPKEDAEYLITAGWQAVFDSTYETF